MTNTLLELELSNEDDFIKRFEHLYQDINSEYNFGNNTIEKINVNKEASQNYETCCQNNRDFVYLNYVDIEKAIYELLYINHISVSKKYMSIEFIIGKSSNEFIIENNFGIHQDIYSTIDDESYTVIIYLHTNCQGGELIFYEKTCCCFEKTILVNTKSSLFSNTKVIIFDGKIFHKPEPFYNGQRCAIVCQVGK